MRKKYLIMERLFTKSTSYKKNLTFFLSVVLLFFFSLFLVYLIQISNESYSKTYNRILEKLDYKKINDHDTLILLARANMAKYGMRGKENYKKSTEEVLNKLETTAYINNDKEIGWGLPYAWDAFGDGTVNSENTVYTYTTAYAGLTFLDFYQLTNDKRYLEVAKRSANVILAKACCWQKEELFSTWYSDNKNDQIDDYAVLNTQALTLSLINKIQHEDRKDQTYEKFNKNFLIPEDYKNSNYEKNEWNWPYSLSRSGDNDLFHLMFIVDYLISEQKNAEADYVLEMAGKYFFDFWGNPKTNRETLGSNNWGPAAYLVYISESGELNWRAKKIAKFIVKDVKKTEFGESYIDPNLSRKLAWDALALIKYEAHGYK